MDDDLIRDVRRFNRVVTQRVGALDASYLSRGRPLGEARVLHEIGEDGADLRALRDRLGLDSGYASRLLRSLERQGLLETRPDRTDGRLRRIHLTEAGEAERAIYETLSNDLAASLVTPLDPGRRDRLVAAMRDVTRLLQASAVSVALEPAGSPEALACVARYCEELAQRFDSGFDPGRSKPADVADMTPPNGFFAVARADGTAVGCGGVRIAAPGIGELKRMWTAEDWRGLGIARRILLALEAEARHSGLATLRLESNRSLVEAHALYRSENYREVDPFSDEPYAHHWFEKSL